MGMLTLLCGVTKMDKIKNEYIKGNLDIMNVAGVMRENRLKWFFLFY